MNLLKNYKAYPLWIYYKTTRLTPCEFIKKLQSLPLVNLLKNDKAYPLWIYLKNDKAYPLWIYLKNDKAYPL